MIKHTPGPWDSVGKGDMRDGGSSKLHACFCGKIVAKNGQTIISHSSFLGVVGKSPEEAEANP